MKNLILSVAFLLCCSLLTAQVFEQGNFVMGGTFGFSTATSEVEVKSEGNVSRGEGTKSTQFNVAPAIGYFVLNNWAVGVGLDYTLNRSKRPENVFDPDTDYDTSYDSDLLFGPFTRLYLPIGKEKAFFVEGAVGFGSSRDEIEVDGNTQYTSNNIIALGVGPGFTIVSSDGVGIEALVKYNWARSNSDINFQGVQTETTNFTNAIDFSIGFQVYFTRLATASRSSNSASNDGYNSKFY